MFQVLYFVSMHLLSSHAYESIKKEYEIELTNGYEEGVVGVHLKNKQQQDKAMKMFLAGKTRCPIREALKNFFTMSNHGGGAGAVPYKIQDKTNRCEVCLL